MTSLTLFIWDRLPVNRIENAPIKIGESFQVIIWASGQKKKEMYQEMARFTPPLPGPWP